jgi:3-oxoacyl-[acyl-carrier-protein] synthase III
MDDLTRGEDTMSQPAVSLIDVSSYLPGEPIGAEYYAQFAESDDLRENVMFRAPKSRHHVAADETAVDMIERAAPGLSERHGHDVIEGADVLITHTQAPDLTLSQDPPRKWWQPGTGELCIGFTDSTITKVLARGNRQVPEVALAVCDRIGLPAKDIDLLVTNQPNRAFLRNWREALELPKSVDTFDDCGNLFGAGMPVNLDRAISDGRVQAGDVVMMAGFAHAGDFAGAAAVRWGGRG